MKITDFMNESLNPKHAIEVYKYNKKFRQEHPDYFDPSGLLVFCGGQGYGKTISAVNYIKQLCNFYNKCILVTNVDIKGLPENLKVLNFNNLDNLINYFEIVNNGEYGVIYFIDEIQVLFNALLKRGMSVQVLEVISQQRKQRKHIIGTAQVYMKIDKVFREQMNTVVICKKLLGCIQYNQLVDGTTITESDGKPQFNDIKKRILYFHTPAMFEQYDTSAIISAYRKEFKDCIMSDEAFEKLKKVIERAEKGEEQNANRLSTNN